MPYLLPYMRLFEIDDQPWFPPFLRARIQAALAALWNTCVPLVQDISAAELVADLITKKLSPIDDYVFVDFCAGGGGPTPTIARAVNKNRRSPRPGGMNGHSSYADAAAAHSELIPFVLTDLHPHVTDWKKAADRDPSISYEPNPINAASVPASLFSRVKTLGRAGAARERKVFRLFNLAFHHFDDPLARAILKDTLQNSDGFGIFELQDRSIGAILTMILGGTILVPFIIFSPWFWSEPVVSLVFSYFIPILPFVLAFDGVISSLRTRTPDEVEALLRSCGGPGADRWELRSGQVQFFWPVGNLNWIICTKRQ